MIIAGDGWGAEAVYAGIIRYTKDFSIYTTDESLIKKATRDGVNIVTLEEIKNEIIICAGYKKIILKDFLKKNRIINIHYSLLPKYRGYHSTVWAILNNEEFLGATIHLMNENIDDGDIIFQYKVKNEIDKTSYDYMIEFNKCIEENIYEVIKKYLDKKILPIKQNIEEASWVGKRNKEDCRIDFTKDSTYLKNFMRALVEPYPLPFFTYEDKEYEIIEVDFHLVKCETHLGRVLNINNQGVYIKIRDGYIILKKLKYKDNIYLANNIIKKIGYKFIK